MAAQDLARGGFGSQPGDDGLDIGFLARGQSAFRLDLVNGRRHGVFAQGEAGNILGDDFAIDVLARGMANGDIVNYWTYITATTAAYSGALEHDVLTTAEVGKHSSALIWQPLSYDK